MNNLLRTNGSHTDFAWLITQLNKEMWVRYPVLYAEYAPLDKVPENVNVVIAYSGDQPIGCGCIKTLDNNTIEIKRMYVEPDFRNRGMAASILTELETWAKELRFSASLLETGTLQPEAVHLYEKQGYIIIENYGPYAGMDTSICMGKKL